MKIKFIIYGNQEDPAGNPVPKLKMTGRQQWTDPAHRYAAWKEYVQWAFANARLKSVDKWDPYRGTKKPIALAKDQFAEMRLKIWWANEMHPDAENVFGSIADSIFENDKHLDGSFAAGHSAEGKGRVEVHIEIQ